MDIRFNFKIILSLLFLLSGSAAVAMVGPEEAEKTVGEELLESVDTFIEVLDIDLEMKIIDENGAITSESLSAVLNTQKFITLHKDATERKGEVEERVNFCFLGLGDALTARQNARKDLTAKINAFKNAIKLSSRFSVENCALCSNAQEAIFKLEDVKRKLVKSLRDLAKKVKVVEVEDNAELKAKKYAFVRGIKHEAAGIATIVALQVARLNRFTKFTPSLCATVYNTGVFVNRNKWWFVGGAAATVVTAGVLAYVMRNRLANISFSKLPLINVFFGRKSVVAPFSVVKPVVNQPRLTV